MRHQHFLAIHLHHDAAVGHFVHESRGNLRADDVAIGVIDQPPLTINDNEISARPNFQPGKMIIQALGAEIDQQQRPWFFLQGSGIEDSQ